MIEVNKKLNVSSTFETGLDNQPMTKSANMSDEKAMFISQPHNVNYKIQEIPEGSACTEFIEAP